MGVCPRGWISGFVVPIYFKMAVEQRDCSSDDQAIDLQTNTKNMNDVLGKLPLEPAIYSVVIF